MQWDSVFSFDHSQLHLMENFILFWPINVHDMRKEIIKLSHYKIVLAVNVVQG
jgi:hypothetical protein